MTTRFSAGELVEERGAGGGAVDHGERALQGLSQSASSCVGDVGAAEVELGFRPSKVPWPMRTSQRGGAASLGLRGRGLDLRRSLSVGACRRRFVAADLDELRARPFGGVGPAVGGFGELAAEFGVAFGADDEDDGGVGVGGGCESRRRGVRRRKRASNQSRKLRSRIVSVHDHEAGSPCRHQLTAIPSTGGGPTRRSGRAMASRKTHGWCQSGRM